MWSVKLLNLWRVQENKVIFNEPLLSLSSAFTYAKSRFFWEWRYIRTLSVAEDMWIGLGVTRFVSSALCNTNFYSSERPGQQKSNAQDHTSSTSALELHKWCHRSIDFSLSTANKTSLLTQKCLHSRWVHSSEEHHTWGDSQRCVRRKCEREV